MTTYAEDAKNVATMSKEVEIVSWNLLDHLNDPLVQHEIINGEPDLGIFPEATAEDVPLEKSTLVTFRNAGYNVFEQKYDDTDGRADRHRLVAIAKPEHIADVSSVSLAGRNVFLFNLANGAQFMGGHWDDRTEARRMRMTTEALQWLGRDAIVAGDLNAMHRRGVTTSLLRAARPVANMLPASDPVPGQKTPRLQRAGSVGQRLTQMASGTTLRAFTNAGFQDADPRKQPTMKKGPIAVQLDHILYRGNVSVVHPTEASDSQGLSDHLKIQARLRIR